jgi:antitoxin component YwqK of YwqJK toxin-antitoxin module
MNIEEINKFDSNEKKHGVWVNLFDNNKALKSTTTYVHGVEHGIFKSWTYGIFKPNGDLQCIANMEHDRLDGEAMLFFY